LRVRPLDRPAVFEDAEAGPHEAAARGFAALDGDVRKAEPGDDVSEGFDRHSEVEAGAEEHVASDAAAAIQVVVGHGGTKATTRFFPSATPSARGGRGRRGRPDGRRRSRPLPPSGGGTGGPRRSARVRVWGGL